MKKLYTKKNIWIGILATSAILTFGIILVSRKTDVFTHSNVETNEKNMDTAISPYNEIPNEPTTVPSFLIENSDLAITELVSDYYNAMLTADKKAYDKITVDDDSIDVDVTLRKMEYIEGYDNQRIYVTQGSDKTGIVAYVVYDLKINSIDTPAPSIDQLLITYVDGEPKLYFNELSAKQKKQIELILNHEEVKELIDYVDASFMEAIKSDSALNDFYQALSVKQNS